MVRSFDMPAASAGSGTDTQDNNNNIYSTSPLSGNPLANAARQDDTQYANGYGYGLKRKSSDHSRTEQATPAVDALPGGWPQTPGLFNANTNTKEGLGGLDGSILSVPNGDGRRERAHSAKSSQSRRSSVLDGDKRTGEVVKEPQTRIGAAEEGYFSQATNGKPAAPGKRPVALENTPSTPVRTGMALPPVEESSPAQGSTTNGMLKPPGPATHHRASSPPAFSHTSSLSPASSNTTTSPSLTRPERLAHRHTLEVPKVSTRTSHDGQQNQPSPAALEGVVSATGRFSPNTPTKRRGSMQLVRRGTRSIHSDMYLDEVPQDEDAARWTEHIKAKRASKKTRVDTDEDQVVVGTRVDEHHVNYVTAYNMLTGIRFVVSRVNAKLERELDDADFSTKQKFSFDITGNELTPSAKYDFKFKDYAPWVFRSLRTKFRLDPAEYLISLTSKYILSELGSPGKSGSFFYFSRDYKYIIKTIHHGEHKFLRKILKDYYNHVCNNPNTLLSQFYGLHRVKLPYGRKIHFVIMNNLFPPHRDIHRTFDLKGSTIGRDFKEEELEKNPRATMKDLNWLRRNLHLEFGPTKKEAFVEQMQRDVALLQRLKIMDYSLLVGIHDMERGNEENLRDKTLQVFQPGAAKPTEEQQPQSGMLARTPSKLETAKRAKELRDMVRKERPIPMEMTLDKMPEEAHRRGFYFYADDGGFQATHEDDAPGEEVYYLGIIDCLTRYNYVKKAEHFWKGMGGHESQISPIPPERYGDRFIKFISGMTMSRERAEQQRLSNTLDRKTGVMLPPGLEGTIDDPRLGGVNLRSDANNPPGTDRVIEKAEHDAEKSVEHGAKEYDVPYRSLGAVRSPDPDGPVLPVIGEAVERESNASKTPSRVTPKHSQDDMAFQTPSRASGRNRPTPIVGNANMPSESLGEVPPPTPPKLSGSISTVDGKEDHSASWGGAPPPTPPKDDRRGRWVDKDLPLPPSATTQLSASPARANVSELQSAKRSFNA